MQKILSWLVLLLQKGKQFVLGHKKLSIIGGIFLIIVIILWNIFAPKQQAVQYQTTQVTKGTLVSSITASGTVSVANKVSITTAASGVVKQLFVKSGDNVSQGDKIAEITLDNAGQQRQTAAYAAYLSAQNGLNSDEAQVNSLQAAMFVANQNFVNDQGVPNPSAQQQAVPKYIEENDAWLAAQAAYVNQQSVIAKDNASVSNAYSAYLSASSVVTAPAAGVVTDVQIAPGMQVGTSTSTSTTTTNLQNIANIKTPGQVSVVVNVSEVDVANVSVGQKATIIFDSLPDTTFTGTVVGINTIGQTTSGVTTYPATIVLDSASDKIYANMSATATIITKVDKNVLTVPTSAIQTNNGQEYVQVMKNGSITETAVTTGDANDTDTVIVSGLSEGDTVVTGTTGGTTTGVAASSPFSSGLRIGGGGFGGGNATFRGAGARGGQ
ncbi:MAG TPA: HlyD family efflux transporter periplasmic adaptor subunit [Patescibacteria group bacterium]|nr:HlyD family efflux transporter periplasmic adaptor subunit [Patescibacteria group bacterium]